MTNKDDYTIELSLTPFEAEVVARVMMDAVLWYASGEFGKAAETIYSTLCADASVAEAGWTPSLVDQRPDNKISRTWVKT